MKKIDAFKRRAVLVVHKVRRRLENCMRGEESISGNGMPLFSDADVIRCCASRIAISGRPTISSRGRLFWALHSTVTTYPSRPLRAALYVTESILIPRISVL